jgi:hypothetical protein
MVPETWQVVERGCDTRGEWVWIDRHQDDRVTAWKLYHIEGRWRVTAIFFSKENLGLNREPERLKSYIEGCRCHPRGIRLSHSRIDRNLEQLANG